MKRLFCLALVMGTLSSLGAAVAQQRMDEDYGAKIREYTTDEKYLSDLVDHLPWSDTVPSPLQYFGDIVGAPGRLHYTDEIYGYLRALAQASDRVQVRSIGRTEENREMIEVIVADQAVLARLESNRLDLNRLSDPRSLPPDQAKEVIDRAIPIYYITCGLHSPETGSPEMVMEMAYRLAVEENEMMDNIRRNVILIFVPAAEADGRDRVVDIYRYRADHKDVGPGLLYWGHYVAHDNNRDGFGLGLALTRNILDSYLSWKATVMHDLHESVPYMYISTGTGPYNEYLDPITIDEWHNLAYEEVGALTRRGMPGVWTHGFYTGWAANYLMWIANNRNAIGRFYETFGNSVPDTFERELGNRQTSREWYRTNPPLSKTDWSLRNNTNYQQSGVLTALNYVGSNRRRFVENYYLKSKRAVEAGRSEAPYAYVIPKDQDRPLATADLVNLLRRQGLEVHRADAELRWGGEKKKDGDGSEVEAGGQTNGAGDEAADANGDEADKKKPASKEKTAPAGSYVIRMDQPYRTLARMLLDKQNFPRNEEPPYDDTGWTLPYLRRVETLSVDDDSILQAPMTLLDRDAAVEGGLDGAGQPLFVVEQNTDDNVAVFRFRLPDVRMHAAEADFEAEGLAFPAGSLIVRTSENGSGLADRLRRTAEELSLRVRGVASLPDSAATHEVEPARVALVHTWVSTPQDEGWWRLAFDKIGIPYTSLSEQDLATTDLNDFDVVIMPRARANPQTLVSGAGTVGDPIPWKKTDQYRHIGVIDQTDDIRKGMGYQGVANLKAFIEGGGVFLTEGTTAAFPIEMGITRRVNIRQTRALTARGGVYAAERSDTSSPILYGYPKRFPVYFSQAPIFQVNSGVGGFRQPDWMKDETWEKEVPRVVLRFAKKDLLMSGMLRGENEMAGTPAIVDVPVGKGHVVLFANRPFWRWETHGSHALVFNTILHWNDLRVGWPERPSEEDDDDNGAEGGQ